MEGLDAITPPTRSVPFRGEVLVVGPLRLEQLGPFIMASRTAITRVALLAGIVEGTGTAEIGAIVLDLLENDGREIAAALSVAVDREADWIGGGTLDEVAGLLEVVAGLNKDFFARRLQLMVRAIKQAISPSEQLISSSS